MKPINVVCLGKHETSDLPCHRAVSYNCGRKCGKKLSCTHHTCELECHDVENKILIKIKSRIFEIKLYKFLFFKQKDKLN